MPEPRHNVCDESVRAAPTRAASRHETSRPAKGSALLVSFFVYRPRAIGAGIDETLGALCGLGLAFAWWTRRPALPALPALPAVTFTRTTTLQRRKDQVLILMRTSDRDLDNHRLWVIWRQM